jgi:hypothetical protein
VVVSHWLLDAIVHVPGLPIATGGTKVGAGLWNHAAAAQTIEFALLATGTAVYARATAASGRAGRWGFLAFVGFIATIQLGNALGKPPPSVTAVAWVGQAQWLLVAWAWWLDRQRTPRRIARGSELAA